jgi:hypothetical protein
MGRVSRLILNYAGEKILIYEKLVKQATIGNTILSHHGKIKFHSHLNLHLPLNVCIVIFRAHYSKNWSSSASFVNISNL